jgi:acid phosphatase type 7
MSTGSADSTVIRGYGIPPTTATAQLQRAWPPHVGVQPLPLRPANTRVEAGSLGIKPAEPLTFFVIGDHGGVKDPTPQNAVTVAMEAEPTPDFVYSLGDVVYFNGDASEYHPQFYEAYAHLVTPILAIPGNHDGDVTDVPGRAPLDTFLANFCSAKAAPPVGSEEYGRDTQTQPYCDWTLLHPEVSIIGLYTNVPSGGHLEPEQIEWLTEEVRSCPASIPLIVAMHHPPYSIDAHHGGSQKMGTALDRACQTAGRYPELVLSGHVHDYQRFTRKLETGQTVAYVVSGNGGYHNLHKLAPGASPGQALAADVVFETGDDSHWGYLKLTVAKGTISGEYVAVPLTGPTSVADTFQLASAAASTGLRQEAA